MQIGMVGLGRMGANMTLRLLRGGHQVVAYDVDQEAVGKVASEGAGGAGSLEELVSKLDAPRALWVMVPPGEITMKAVRDLAPLLQEDDVVIEGGNSRYTESITLAEELGPRGISLLDAGTSGGVWGLEEGYCLMIGGDEEAFRRLEPAIATLAPEDGYAHVGPTGAGHFVKMVHNGIEYALMQGYAEGFEILKGSQFDLDLATIAELWRHGSVVRSWLLDLTASALSRDSNLDELSDWVEDTGEGRWTVQTAVDNATPAPTIALSLFARFASRQDESFAGKLLAALRQEFGGHAVRKPRA